MANPPLTTLMTADTFQYFAKKFEEQWGIFLNNQPVVTADNVASFEYREDWSLCDFPVEKGAFASYNKVYIPYVARFRFSAGGSQDNRAALLKSIAGIAGDYNLYDAASPEKTYLSCNVSHYDYRRTNQNGVGLIVVDVWLTQVNEVGQNVAASTTAPSGISTGDTAQPTGAASISDGVVQAQPVTPPALPLISV